MARKTFRVYFTTHHDGRKTGILLRTWDAFFDRPPPSAYGDSEDDVLRQLEAQLREIEVKGDDHMSRYLWDEVIDTQEVTVEIHPLTALKHRLVIGKKRIPLRLTYTHCKLPNGGYRVSIPRFGGYFVLEELGLSHEILRHAVSTSLLGENPRWIYEFRRDGDEYVREWEPKLLLRLDEQGGGAREAREPSVLEAVADELVDKAARHKLPASLGDPGDEAMFAPLIARSPPPSILLVGGPGSGKSTWVRKLAKHLVPLRREQKVPRIWATSSERLIAGMVYLGMWQERAMQVVEALSHEGDYLFVDRLTALLKPQPDGASLGDILLPAAEAGEISLIAECTEAELERCQRRFASQLSTFTVVRLAETSAQAMVGLLERYLSRKESAAKVHPAGLRRLIAHLTTFAPDACFPGKGFRFIDWLTQDLSQKGARTLYPRDVSEAYARYSGLPVELIADDVPAGATQHSDMLKRRVIGQPSACDTVAKVLARFKAGLNDPERPLGTLLFVGPTGVGKTELTKQLARYLFGSEERLIRLDMSEYMMPGSSARMMEVGRGARSLAQMVRDQPLSLVLLDEIEKAHPEVFDLLLGVLGEGRLTDSYGRLVDFRMTLIVMTSNIGVTEKAPIGFGELAHDSFAREVRRHFRPELVNRIDHIIPFRQLSRGDVLEVVDLEIEKANLRTGLVRRGLRLVVHPQAKGRLAELGYQPTRGARPLRRVIEERVITPLAARMAHDAGLREREIAVVVGGTEDERGLGQAAREVAIVL